MTILRVYDLDEKIRYYDNYLRSNMNYGFENMELLKTALTHSSIRNEYKNLFEADNEKLEFLGDSVLDLIVSKFLCQKYEFTLTEGEMTVFRSNIVKESSLAIMAKKISLEKNLILSKSINQNSQRTMDSLLADAFEALVAAIMIDSSYEKVENIILDKFSHDFTFFICDRNYDYKSELNIWATSSLNITPEYELVKGTGKDHNRSYESLVRISGEIFGSGKGRSKKESEQMAAKVALEIIEKRKDD